MKSERRAVPPITTRDVADRMPVPAFYGVPDNAPPTKMHNVPARREAHRSQSMLPALLASRYDVDRRAAAAARRVSSVSQFA
jgi:hypothetical protein